MPQMCVAAFEEAVRSLATEDRSDHLIQTDTVNFFESPSLAHLAVDCGLLMHFNQPHNTKNHRDGEERISICKQCTLTKLKLMYVAASLVGGRRDTNHGIYIQ